MSGEEPSRAPEDRRPRTTCSSPPRSRGSSPERDRRARLRHEEAGASPAFKPAENPYPNGIYAEGIIESVQASGSNINIFSEGLGRCQDSITVAEGQEVLEGTDLVHLDDSVPKAQAGAARAVLKTAEDTLAKQEAAHALDPRSVSRDALDTARSAAAAR